MPSSYGYAAIAVTILAILAMLVWIVARIRAREAALQQAQSERDANRRVSDANMAAADSRATDRGPTPGLVVRPRPKPTGDV